MPDDTMAPPISIQGRRWIHRRIFPVLLLLFLSVLGFAGILEAALRSGPPGRLQDGVTTYLDTSEKKAVEAFAVARAINATVSVLKSTDLGTVFAQIAPMEVLEPVDDLAKQFSDVMVVSIVAILLQRLVLAVAQAWAFAYVLPVGCLLLAGAYGVPGSGTMAARLAALGRTLIVLALFARCVVLAAGWVGESVTHRFLESDLATSLDVMHASGGSSEQLSSKFAASETPAPGPAPPGPPTGEVVAPSMFDRLGDVARSTTASTTAMLNRGAAAVRSVGAWMPDKQTMANLLFKLPAHIVRVIEIFLVQTIVTPLCVAAVFYAVLRGLVRPMR